MRIPAKSAVHVRATELADANEVSPASVSNAPNPPSALPAAARLFPSTKATEREKAPGVVTFRPHEKLEPPSFESAFRRTVGTQAISELRSKFSDKPVLLFAGDQLTGKSTLAKATAKALGGPDGVAAGTGAIVRKMAADRGISVEDMAKALKDEPSTDVQIDYRACEMIAAGEVDSFESRLAGQLGKFLKGLGRENVLSVYLRCAPRERALRYVAREVSPEARARLEPLLDVAADADLEACLRALGKIDDPAAQQVAANFAEIAGRDSTDLGRLKALYGVDYQDASSFDLILDTTGKTPAELQAELESFVTKYLENR